jgi:hypothetical protein
MKWHLYKTSEISRKGLSTSYAIWLYMKQGYFLYGYLAMKGKMYICNCYEEEYDINDTIFWAMRGIYDGKPWNIDTVPPRNNVSDAWIEYPNINFIYDIIKSKGARL